MGIVMMAHPVKKHTICEPSKANRLKNCIQVLPSYNRNGVIAASVVIAAFTVAENIIVLGKDSVKKSVSFHEPKWIRIQEYVDIYIDIYIDVIYIYIYICLHIHNSVHEGCILPT